MAMNDSSDWTLQGFSLGHYRRFMQTTLELTGDTTLSRVTLYERAGRHLDVLDKPEFEVYNRPEWLAKSLIFRMHPEKLRAFSVKRFFQGMYRTADEHSLTNGHRFVSAAICACALLLAGDADILPEDRLAHELSILALDIWFIDQFTYLSCDLDKSFKLRLSEKTKEKVFMRDEYTCPFTGTVDNARGGMLRKLLAEETGSLEVAPIFHRSLSQHDELDLPSEDGRPRSDLLREMRTLDFLKWFCELGDITAVDANSPDNCLLLEHAAHAAFGRFLWALKPTEVPNRYRVHVYVMRSEADGTAPVDDYVTFRGKPACAGASVVPEVEPPNPELLRAHAVFADVLHYSGLGALHDPNGIWDDDDSDILDDSEDLLVPETRVPGAGVVRKIKSWARARRAEGRNKQHAIGRRDSNAASEKN